METDTGLFDIEIYCNVCGSDNVEILYDRESNRLCLKCECGEFDYVELENM